MIDQRINKKNLGSLKPEKRHCKLKCMADKYKTQSHLKLFKNIHSSDPKVKSDLSSALSFV